MTKSRIRDQLLYALLAVIFAAVAVVVTWNWSGIQQQTTPVQKQQAVVKAQTSNDLMQELNQTVDESWNGDLQGLRKDAGSL